MAFKTHCLVGIALLMASLGSAAQNNTHFAIPTLAETITLDGHLNEPHWQNAKKISLDYVTRPFENTSPPVKTDVLLYEDGKNLYVAFNAHDANPDAIRAFFRDRDKTWGQDLVGIKIDTFNNSRLAYQFFTNAYGIQSDSIQNELTGKESDSWDAIWHSKGQIHAQGYTVEMIIPLRVMSFNSEPGVKTWRMELIRFFPRSDTYRIANRRIDRNNTCDLCQMGTVTGFSGATQVNNIAVVPSVVFRRGRQRDLYADDDWDYRSNQDAGVDFKWSISPEVSLQATVNPDFSQVESDAAQLTINTPFSLFLKEKRPFFVENADYFSSNYNLVYTRNIIEPDYGAKVTGRVDNHTFGVFIANDNSTRFIVPGNIGSRTAQIDKRSNNAALRYRYDLSDQLSVGAVATLRQGSNYNNYVYGVDGKYQITDKDTLRIQAIQSQTKNPSDLYRLLCDNDCLLPEDYSEAALRTKRTDTYQGTGYRLTYGHSERNWYFDASHRSNGRGLRTDLGYLTRADWTISVVGGGYHWYNANEHDWWNKVTIRGDWDVQRNDAGELLEREIETHLDITAALQSTWSFGYVTRDRISSRQQFDSLSVASSTLFNEWFVYHKNEIRPLPSLKLKTNIRSGDSIDFDNNRIGEQFRAVAEAELSLGKNAQINIRHTHNDLRAQGEKVFTARLTDLRFNYQINQRQGLRAILINSDIERNTANYIATDVDALSRSFSMQLLYSYKVNPLTKFFIGYSSGAIENEDIQRLTDNEQSVFMKLSYAWLG